MQYRFHTADVFTDRVFGGNPLAVLPEAEGIDEAAMQRVAAEFNLSETTFVLPPDDPAHTCRVRIFTPANELPFAGHPTVGTALVLAWSGRVPEGTERIVFEEAVGPVPVALEWREGRAVKATLSSARLPEIGPPSPAAEALAEVQGLEAGDLGGEAPELARGAQGVSCGVPFLFVPLRDRDVLARCRVDTAAWERVMAGGWAHGLFAFTLGEAAGEIRARMFAPTMGIVEDPATGGAVTALAGYLAPFAGKSDGTARWRVHQGVEMGRPSLLELAADLTGGAVSAIRVGGSAVPVSEGSIEVPEGT